MRVNKFAKKYQAVWFPRVGDIVRFKHMPEDSIQAYRKVATVYEDNTIGLLNPQIHSNIYVFNKNEVIYVGRSYPAWVIDKISRSTSNW